MSYRIHKGDGVIIKTDDGTFQYPSTDMAYPDVDALVKLAGTGRKVSYRGVWVRIESVTRVTGWWGYVEGENEWMFDRSKSALETALKDIEADMDEAGHDDDYDDDYDLDDDDDEP